MSLPFFIARRYLFSKKKHNAINIISGISVCGVALATLALVCTLSVFNGFQDMVAGFFTAFDPELKMNHYGKGKYLLRHAFQEDSYLPQEILWREKAAFSDAVGHSMVDYLKEYAESVYTDQEMETLSEKYTYARPFTKESLLYREIFEKYYPGQAEMIAGFWMPNKEWEGCDVNDPSARVLSNYGESGK